MNQEKIGKFIAQLRKEKNMTQVQLAEKLGVTDRSISKWETGKCMPDLSLFKPLCEELGITINELLSGEKIEKELYQEKFEENIVNTIDHTNKKIGEKNFFTGAVLMVIGILITLIAVSIFPSESSWSSLYSVVGAVVAVIGFGKLTKKFGYFKRIAMISVFFVLFMSLLMALDYVNVVNNHQPPRFSTEQETRDNIIMYKTPLYNVFRINADTANEYYIVDKIKKYDIENVPATFLDEKKSGISNIAKYKSQYVGDNVNTADLIGSLPLSEYGFNLQIDTDTLGLTVNYYAADWYDSDYLYVQKGLVYNTVCIFLLIDNVRTVKYNFSGSSYEVSRDRAETCYPDYDQLKRGIEADEEIFREYVQCKIDDYEFTESMFKIMFEQENDRQEDT